MLSLVPTPLGNLGDITRRALDALTHADLIVAEDTRVARRLLNALSIGSKEIWSYREQNAASVTAGIVERAKVDRVAFISDAGMPAISDPGSDLVAAARAAGVTIEVLPGPSAALGVAVLSGFPLRRFIFEGFPPRTKAAREKVFRTALGTGATSLWFESPQRIRETLATLGSIAPGARVFLVREYTKRFEQQVLGSPADVIASLEEPVRGEIAFAIAPHESGETEAPVDAAAEIDRLLDRGLSVREIAKTLSEAGAGDRRAIYAEASDRKRARGGAR